MGSVPSQKLFEQKISSEKKEQNISKCLEVRVWNDLYFNRTQTEGCWGEYLDLSGMKLTES
jgi:hypothetical protein